MRGKTYEHQFDNLLVYYGMVVTDADLINPDGRVSSTSESHRMK